jgi:hypothetical protein|tara:strand:- start:304 stop:528 length:225 start_codon:yes stop_codon:yes gene_type:complete
LTINKYPLILWYPSKKKTNMDKTSYENWVRVKETFEESGNTDNFYYKRACAIVGGQPDPLENLKHGTQDDTTET